MRPGESLEKKCRDVITTPDHLMSGEAQQVKHRIALTLEQLEHGRYSAQWLLGQAEHLEMSIKTRFENIVRLPFDYDPGRWVQRDSIRNQLTTGLIRIENQRRDILSNYQRQRCAFHDQLFNLLQKHHALDDGTR